MKWLLLTFAILFEVAGTTAMKLSVGFSRPLPSVLVVVCYGASLALLTLTLRHMDVSLAYAIWSGVGTALITVVGVLYFAEDISWLKLLSIGLIILGVAGLNLGRS